MMVDAAMIRRRLRKLDELLQSLRQLREQSRKEYLSDEVVQAAAERQLQVAIQVVLDLGAHLLSARGIVDWEEYREIPRRLAKEGVIAAELADRLERAAGQRNVLVHLYLEVDPELVYETLTGELDAFVAFAESVDALMEEGEDTLSSEEQREGA